MKKTLSYNNLIKTISLTDFKLKYQGSILGYLWSLVKPLFLFLVLLFVFTRVFKIGNTVPNYPVYLLTGIVIWSFFIDATISGLYSIVNKGDLIRKIYFPRIILTISNSATAFLTFIANLIIIFIFMFFFGVKLNIVHILLLPLLLLELYVFALGVGLFLGALFVKFRDIAHIWEIALQALFYATPILYPVSLVPGMLSKIILFNPLAQIIQDARYLMITTESETVFKAINFPLSIIPYVLSFFIFFLGTYVFEKMAANFAEEV